VTLWQCVAAAAAAAAVGGGGGGDADGSDGWLWLVAVRRDKRAVAAATRSSEDIAIDSCRRDTRLRQWLTLPPPPPPPPLAAAAAAAPGRTHSHWLSSTFICRRWELAEIERHYRPLARRQAPTVSRAALARRCNNSEIELKSSSCVEWCDGISVSESRTVRHTACKRTSFHVATALCHTPVHPPTHMRTLRLPVWPCLSTHTTTATNWTLMISLY